MHNKYEQLKEYLRSLESVAVAYSGGVDSTFLLYAAHDALGDNAVAITANSCVLPARELDEAVNFCEGHKIRQIICDIDIFAIDGFADNPPNRCYICKKGIFSQILQAAGKAGIAAVAEGSNLDDTGDYRPGLAAVAEMGILSPLREIGFTKAEIREQSRCLGLPTWYKPAFACLASRFAYGERITPELLTRVDKAERFLSTLGIHQMRVRIHGVSSRQSGDIARIEVPPEDFAAIIARREQITQEFKKYGFSYTALDLTGYRTGSMNEVLNI